MPLNPYIFSADQPVRWVAGKPKSRTLIVLTGAAIIIATKVKEPIYQEFEHGWKLGQDAEELLPDGFLKIPLKRLTRLQFNESSQFASGAVTLHYVAKDEAKSVALEMGDAGMRDNFVHNLNVRTKWKRHEEDASPFTRCCVSVGLGFVFALIFVAIYWGVVSGNIREIHVVLALLINHLGPASLLFLGGLAQLIGILFAVYHVISPPKRITYEPDYDDLERHEQS
jgi:hypothetical protein